MTNVVLFILAAMWAVVLVPPWFRNRGDNSRSRNSIGTFQNQLNVLGQSAPLSYRAAHTINPSLGPIGARIQPGDGNSVMATQRNPAVPGSPGDAERRRRDIVRVLVSGMAISFLAWLVFSSALVLALHLLLDVVFFSFIALVLQMKRAENDAAMRAKVHYLPQTQAVRAEQPVLVRRSGS